MARHETAGAQRRSGAADEPIQVVMVSGFLGAGKTTALEAIGERLTAQGYTVGMVTNDQASGLVDTSILDTTDGTVVEIPGGCFCCNFEQLLGAAHSIEKADVDVLLAEPVGSCTDLVATVVNPLRRLHAEDFSVAPLSVVLDPDRVQAILGDDEATLPEEVRYIFRMQIEEADLIVLNKTDTLPDDETARLVDELADRAGDRPVFPVSARAGDGIERWMGAVIDGVDADGGTDIEDSLAGQSRALTDIDYDTYAEGEARLGWVNMAVSLDGPFEVSAFQTELMTRLQGSLRAADIEVAHLKFSVSADGGLSHANLTSIASEPGYGGDDLGTVSGGDLVFNARAVGVPERIRTIAADAITAAAMSVAVSATIEEEQAFRPEYPEPEYRMDDAADAP